MAPRTPLRVIDPNRPAGHELSSKLRNRIIGAHDAGRGATEIGRMYNIPESTVRYTIEQESKRDNQTTLPRSGAPRTYTKYFERQLLRYVRLNPKHTYEQIRTALGTSLKRGTLRKILKKHGITKGLAGSGESTKSGRP
jgi:hypothetical protein